MAALIDGKAIASDLRTQLTANVAKLVKDHGVKPGLAVVLVGDDPASEVYVRSKSKQTVEVGMESFKYALAADTSESDLLDLITKLNNDNRIHGILVQLPLPQHINEGRVIEAINPAKDVDGFHPVNIGRLVAGEESLIPCTPQGCIILAKSAKADLTGCHAVVVGRSNIVGKPVAQLLLQENCTVTIAHSRTRDLPGLCATADLLVAAVGRPEMVQRDWVKPGAIVVDVGINRIPAPEKGEGKTRLVGDVSFDEVSEIASAITPVPGGVGPMTIACLLKNTFQAALRIQGISEHEFQ
ncbi:MAG: bifunctional methylenetetrahydrofolate dehydrogenase/methenyltetrahydrofolate cyclohydrolase FolD [Methyloligellaceae bacterium]